MGLIPGGDAGGRVSKLAAARARMIPEVPDTGDGAVPSAKPAVTPQ